MRSTEYLLLNLIDMLFYSKSTEKYLFFLIIYYLLSALITLMIPQII